MRASASGSSTTATVIPDHRLVRFWIRRHPLSSAVLGLPVAANAAQEEAIFFASTCLQRIARSLFAALCVIKAELQSRRVPSTGHTIKDRGLPLEEVSTCRRGFQPVFQPCHLHNIVAHAQSVQAWIAGAHIRKCLNLLLRVRFLQCGEIAVAFSSLNVFYEACVPLFFRRAGGHPVALLPSPSQPASERSLKLQARRRKMSAVDHFAVYARTPANTRIPAGARSHHRRAQAD